MADLTATQRLTSSVENVKSSSLGGEDRYKIDVKRTRLEFPKDDEYTDYFINFMVFKNYEFNRRQTKDVEYTIKLPLPQGLATGYSARYNNENLGPIGQIVAQGVTGSQGGSVSDIAANGISALKNRFNSAAAMNLAASGVQENAAPILAGIVGNALGGQLGGIASYLTGIAVGESVKGAFAGLGVARNPHMAVLFDGPDFRRHSFRYKLVPKNEEESDLLADIISVFKQGMLPSYIHDKQFFNYPKQFDIQIPLGASDKNRYMFDIGTSVLTSFTADYMPNGPHFHDIGGVKAPVAVDIALEFLETTVTTREETGISRANR